MKINTITCHDVYNFGASLQAFALQKFLSDEGNEVEVIDYKPDYLSGHFDFGKIGNSVYDKPVVRQMYQIAKLPSRVLALTRKRAFDQFTKKYLRLTKRFNDYEELKADAPRADIYIAGSDQIWNTLFNNGRDKAFYLDFGDKSVKRISYAASFATPDIRPEYFDFVKHELQNIDKISIRESCALPLLKKLGRQDGVSVCDPVFLLSREQWCDLLTKTDATDKKYILVYLSEQSDKIREIVSQIKSRTHWPVLAVGTVGVSYADKYIRSADPLDFVDLIRCARFVISNSFHASAFSIIMGVDFCVVNRSEEINERMRSLLEDFALQDRLVSSYTDKLLDKIDYVSVRKLLKRKISFSKQWLTTAIDSAK